MFITPSLQHTIGPEEIFGNPGVGHGFPSFQSIITPTALESPASLYLTRSPTFTNHLHIAISFIKFVKSPSAAIKHNMPAISRGWTENYSDSIRLTTAKKALAWFVERVQNI
jgi:hypothetical protein|tara:strand:+ start:1574 stop:1909 length:336 start_codon:yes stop_codon:yes gene_type:complete